MQRTAILITALVALAACDAPKTDAAPAKTASAKTAPAKAAPAEAEQDATAKGAEQDAPEDAEGDIKDPWQEKLATRVLAKSGLDVGSRLSAFDIINCESGDQYCQVCKFGGNAKIMAVGTSDDEAFRKDLKDLDAIAQKYEANNVKAFAVITDIVDGKAQTPGDAKALQEKADAIRKELGIKMPVVVPAPEEGGNKIWDEYYNITASRTVMFADGKNNVKFSAVGPDDWAGLATEIDKTIADAG